MHVESLERLQGKLVKYQQLQGLSVVYQNEAKTVHASGPGDVRLVQLGTETLVGPRPRGGTKPVKKKQQVYKLTYVRYGETMFAHEIKHYARFRKDVRVRHFPLKSSRDPLIKLPPEKILSRELVQGAFEMRCNHLLVYQRPPKVPNGKTSQRLEAEGNVKVFSQDFRGEAHRVTYNDANDRVIFDGGENGVAILQKTPQRGGRPQKIIGKKITYILSTGEHQGENLEVISQ